MAASTLLFEAMPSLLGILVIVYLALIIVRARENFFKVMTSWTITVLAVSLGVYWVLFLWSSFSTDWRITDYPGAALTFSVFTSWLSVFAVHMTTWGGRHNDRKIFAAWMRKNPFNIVTIWGIVALAVIGAALAVDLTNRNILNNKLLVVVVALAFVAASSGINIFGFVRWFSRTRMPRLPPETQEANAMLVAAWIGIPVTESILGFLVASGWGYEDYNPHVWILTIFFALLVRAVMTTQFMAITVEAEMETVRREGFRVFDIPRGVYILQDERSGPAFALFSDLVTLPLTPSAKIPGSDDSASATLEYLIPRGLVVTREFPEKVRERHRIAVTPIIWLTETPGERRIAPTSLAVLTDTIIRFMESNPNSIVLLEGIEYIITFNDFRKVLRSLDLLNETAWITKARLLIAANPKAFDSKELALLERNRTVVRGRVGIEELKKESIISRGAS